MPNPRRHAIAKIEVCSGDTGKCFLRLWASTRDGEVIRFETGEEFSKPEADYRAMSLSAHNGWDMDELPTHDKICPDPEHA